MSHRQASPQSQACLHAAGRAHSWAESWTESSSTCCGQAWDLQLSAGSRADLDGDLPSQREEGCWHIPSRAPLACFNQDQKLTRDNHRSPPVFPVSYLLYHLSEIRGKCQDRAPVPLRFDSEELLLFFSFILNFTSMTDKGAPLFFYPPPHIFLPTAVQFSLALHLNTLPEHVIRPIKK